MTKEEFLKNYWFNFPKPKGTAYTLEYAPKNDNSVEAVKEITLNNAEDLNQLDMWSVLSRKLIIDNDYELTHNDVKSIIDSHEEYNRKHKL